MIILVVGKVQREKHLSKYPENGPSGVEMTTCLIHKYETREHV